MLLNLLLTCLPTHILWYFPHKITLKEANGLEKYDTCTCIWTWFEFRTGIHSYWSSFISTVFFHGRMQDWWTYPHVQQALTVRLMNMLVVVPTPITIFLHSKMLHVVHVTLHFSLSGFGDLMDGKHCITRHFLPKNTNWISYSLSTNPFWVQLGFHSGHNHNCFDHYIIHIQQNHLEQNEHSE